MKRWLLLLPAVLLLLAGCKQQETPPSTEAATVSPGAPTQTQPENMGLYDPDSIIEAQTGGTVKVYELEDGFYEGVIPVGGDLVLIQSADQTVLTLLTGEYLEPAVTTELTYLTATHTGLVQLRGEQLFYLDEADKAVVYLSTSLREISRLRLPEDQQGSVCLSPDGNLVYYCTGEGVWELNLTTGVSRLLRQQQARYQSVDGIFLDGRYLRCRIEYETGEEEILLISAKTGETVEKGTDLLTLQSGGENYFLALDRGSVTEYVFGTMDGEPENLWPEDQERQLYFLPEQNAVISVDMDEVGAVLAYYDLTSGKRVSTVELSDVDTVTAVTGSSVDGRLWCLAGSGERNLLLGWDIYKSAAEDGTVYTEPHYTREARNTEGLNGLTAEITRLEETYGVDILFSEETAAAAPGDYTLETEYLVQAYERWLPILESAMAQFPEGFFRTAAQRTSSGVLHIGLVRGIYGAEEKRTLPDVEGVQYWRGGDMYLMLALDDGLYQSFFPQMMHTIETRVLSVCTAFYAWDDLNPSDFAYDNDYIRNLSRRDDWYISGDSRAFIDTYAMSFAKEDRARILEYAVLPDCGHYFRTETMQNKLRLICDGIRQAFGLEDAQTLIWEQYLDKAS